MSAVPLSVLDLVPVTSGSDSAQALRNTIDLAQRCEQAGYRRYWFAEHHLNPGIAATSPAVVISLVAGHTSRIRLGSAGVQMAHRTTLSTVEEFGLIDALHPGRLDLGLGRSGPQLMKERIDREAAPSRPKPAHAPNGLPLPRALKLDTSRLLASPMVAAYLALMQQPGAQSPDYGDQVAEMLALLNGDYRTADGTTIHILPGEGANVEIWILGSSAGQSAAVAGKHGLRFAANYHISPGTVLETVEAYRNAFTPSTTLDRPYVAVSADVVVAEDDATAQRLAAGYAPWVRSIRLFEGAIPFPSPEEADAFEWTDEDRAIVADRVATQFVGSPATVAAKLRQLQEATGADELVITTITHSHTGRVRSYELLASEWNGPQ